MKQNTREYIYKYGENKIRSKMCNEIKCAVQENVQIELMS